MNYKVLQLPPSDYEILTFINISLVFHSEKNQKNEKLFAISETYGMDSLTIAFNSINQKLTVLNDFLDPYCSCRYYWSQKTIRDEMYEFYFPPSSIISSEKRLEVTESILKELE